MIEGAALLAPASVEEACALVRDCAARDAALGFAGAGTEAGLGYPAERVDAVLQTRGLTRIVEYAPGDQTVTVEGGLALGALQRELAREGQRLALDPPYGAHATLGGLLATNAFGPRRTRFGTLRDLIVGIGFVRADGALVHGGGKVVKNVAGFDLPKLLVGSLGTLGLITSATFRLHPLPERSLWLAAPGAAATQVYALCRALTARQLEPAAVVAILRGERYTLYVLFEGFAPSVAAQAEVWRELVQSALGVEVESVDEEDPAAFEASLAGSRMRGNLRVRVSVAPASFVQAEREVAGPLRAAFAADVTAYPTVGALFAGGDACDEAAALTALERARAAAEALGGTLVASEMPERMSERFDPYGTLPPAFPIMRALKERFDPNRRFNRGRFVGRL